MKSGRQKAAEGPHLEENMLYETEENPTQMLHTTENVSKTS